MKENILGSKVTSSLAGLIAALSLMGFDADPTTAEAVHQFLTQHANSIANLVAVIALLLSSDDGLPGKKKSDTETEVRRVMSLVLAERGQEGKD